MNDTDIVTVNDETKLSRLPSLLRILGGAALILAMYSFLAKGWENGNDSLRYLMMLSHTGLLAVIGLASGRWLQDGKSARLLLTLALVSIPVNYAILGAFLFSQIALITVVPDYVSWSVSSLSTAVILTAIAQVVLIPVMLISFRVLTRHLSTRLSWLYLFANLALLIPIRDPASIAVMALLFIIAIMYASRRIANNQLEAATQEGVIALTLQLLPLGVLVIRTLWLHHFDLYLLTMLVFTLYAILRQLSILYQSTTSTSQLLNRVAVLPALLMGPMVVASLDALIQLPEILYTPLAGWMTAITIYDIARREPLHKIGYLKLLAMSLLVTSILNGWMYPGLLTDSYSTIIAIVLLYVGFHRRNLTIFSSGVLLFIYGLFNQVVTLITQFNFGSWFGLALLGVLTIVLASVLESPATRLRSRIQTSWIQLKAWEK